MSYILTEFHFSTKSILRLRCSGYDAVKFGRRIIYTEDGRAGFSETLIDIRQNKVRFKCKVHLQIVFEIIFS
jgi:hypothetical protein